MSSKRKLEFDTTSAPAKQQKIINTLAAASTPDEPNVEPKNLVEPTINSSGATSTPAVEPKIIDGPAATSPATPTKPTAATESSPLSPSKVTHPATKVDICAMLTALSPMKPKHFVGELVDEHRSIRFVGFDRAQKARLDTFDSNKTPVLLKNCDIQLNKYTNMLEVMIKGYTRILESPITFNIEDPSTIGTHSIMLDKLTTMKEYDKVNVQVKVTDVNTPQLVGSNKTKQEVTIADQSGTATLTLWQNDINSLILSDCYSMKRLVVRVFQEKYSLSIPDTAAIITPIDNIPDVSDVLDPIQPTLENAEVCAVKQVQKYKVCIACNGKVFPIDESGSLGCCQKCNMKIKMSTCNEENLFAKFMVTGYDEESTQMHSFITLVGYGDLLKAITETDEVTDATLLKSRPFKVTYNSYFVITSISRND